MHVELTYVSFIRARFKDFFASKVKIEDIFCRVQYLKILITNSLFVPLETIGDKIACGIVVMLNMQTK